MSFNFNGIPGANVQITGGVSIKPGSYSYQTTNANTTLNMIGASTVTLRTLNVGIAGTGGGITYQLKDGANVIFMGRISSTNELNAVSLDLGNIVTTGAITIVTTGVSGGQIAYFNLNYEA